MQCKFTITMHFKYFEFRKKVKILNLQGVVELNGERKSFILVLIFIS